MTSLRVVFMGTPDFAVPALGAISDAGHEIVAVYTQPARRGGRGMAEKRSAVHDFAVAKGFAVHTPAGLKDPPIQEAFAAHGCDVAIIAAYGVILPKPILEAPALGCLNIHASLLPRWRGAAPIQRAIMAGDEQTGISIMAMDEGLDTGAVCLEQPVAIPADMTAGDLHDRLAEGGAELIVAALDKMTGDRLACTPQREAGVTYAAKITKAEARINWALPAPDVHNHIRGLSPWPGAWFEVPVEDRTVRVKVLKSVVSGETGSAGTVLDDHLTIACADASVRLIDVQREGRGAMSAEDLLRGLSIAPGTKVQ